MKSPYESYQRAQLGALALVVVLIVVGLFQLEHRWILLLMFYVLAASIAFEALIDKAREQKVNMIIHFTCAVIIFLFTTLLYF
ncbi:hypothetical protein QRD89_17250 [Halobacillus sp. ACCC02827]|uniref:hypothetical protein n=1 Tax=Bacillaceae TaxID=186817 RepID=UPI0002A4DFEA|nr:MULTISPECIES: hypothetical protein [Bacillaceae]ELK48993.1 hypothetical protein D479_00125 [Halobacillus sp. BAB-2008]QHT48213.1 hypothetical protein M662_17570 [Bacillus sp. SB49]WJE15446.1 hypothetical protein QRD89_17250 [Halobacillus sp. ACCC02827]